MIRNEISFELADVILKHQPDASVEMISEVISEWGDLFDDHKFAARVSKYVESAAPKSGQRPPR
jgi:hypothetical protein